MKLTSKNRPKLTVLVGPPACGKSTLTKKFEDHDTLIVSSDDIRYKLQEKRFGDAYTYRPEMNKEVFKVFHSKVEEGLEKGMHVVADATSMSYKDRSTFRDIKRRLNKKNIFPYMEAMVVVENIQEIMLNDAMRVEEEVGKEVIVHSLKRFRVPNPRIEEWDVVKIVRSRPDTGHPQQYFDGLDKIADTYDQKNKWHTLTLGGHIEELKEMSPNNRLKTISQYHDYGKLFTQEIKEGQARYYGHANVSSYLYLYSLAEEFVQELSEEQIENAIIIERHMTRLDEWRPSRALTEMGIEAYFLLQEFDEIDKRGGSKKGKNRYEGLTSEEKRDILNNRRKQFFEEMEEYIT